MYFEQSYISTLYSILKYGNKKKTRNGNTLSLPFKDIIFSFKSEDFPLLKSRKIFYKGVLGEYAAIIRGPQSKEDFPRQGSQHSCW